MNHPREEDFIKLADCRTPVGQEPSLGNPTSWQGPTVRSSLMAYLGLVSSEQFQ